MRDVKKADIRKVCGKIAKKVDYCIFVVSTLQYEFSLELLRLLKSTSSDLITIIAGREATFLTKKVLFDGFDIAIKGEIEAVLPVLVEKLNTLNVKDIPKYMDGVGVRISKKEIKIREGINKVNVNTLPLPDFSIFPSSLRKQANISWWVSRGCPFKCAYCYEPFFWNPLRIKNVEKVREELELYKKFFPFNHIFFHDSTFNVGPWKNILKIVSEAGLSCSFNVKLDLLKENDLKFLKANTPFALFSGIESCSQKVLKKINRCQNTGLMIKVAKKLNKIIPFLTLSFIIGLPGETITTIMKMKQLIRNLLLRDKIFQVTVRVFTPYPGTPIFHNPKKYGVEILSTEFGRYDRYSFPPVIRTKCLDEFTIYYLFLDIYSMIVKLNLRLAGMNIKEFEKSVYKKINLYATNIYKIRYG